MLILGYVTAQLILIAFFLYSAENLRKRSQISEPSFDLNHQALFSSFVCVGSSAGLSYLALTLWYAVFDHPHNPLGLLVISLLVSILSRGAAGQVYSYLRGETPIEFMKCMLIVQLSPLVWTASMYFISTDQVSGSLCLFLTAVIGCAVVFGYVIGFASLKTPWKWHFVSLFAIICGLDILCTISNHLLVEPRFQLVRAMNPFIVISGIIYLTEFIAHSTNESIDLWNYFMAPALAKTVVYLLNHLLVNLDPSLMVSAGLELYVLALLYGSMGVIGAIYYSNESILNIMGIPTSMIYLQDDTICGPFFTAAMALGRIFPGRLARFGVIGEFFEGLWESITG